MRGTGREQVEKEHVASGRTLGGPQAAAVERTDPALGRLAARFEHLFASSIVGVIVADLGGRIAEANDCFLDLHGYDREDLPLRWDLMTPREWRTLDEAKIRELRATGVAQNWDKEYFHKTGARVPITVCAALMDGVDAECIFVVLDRTAKSLAEDALHRSEERYQDRLRALAFEVSVAAERERRRIAIGVHDRIGQNLAVAKLRVEALQLTTSEPASATTLQELADLLDQTVKATRSLTFELSPPLLFELGLEAALKGLVRRMETRDGIRCRFETDAQPKPLPTDSAIVLHQVVRELLFNVVKHARAASSGVFVTRDHDRIRIVVTDDGVGFEATPAEDPRDGESGFGLFSARERLRQVGGALEVDSTPGEGTRVALTAPLSSPGDARA